MEQGAGNKRALVFVLVTAPRSTLPAVLWPRLFKGRYAAPRAACG